MLLRPQDVALGAQHGEVRPASHVRRRRRRRSATLIAPMRELAGLAGQRGRRHGSGSRAPASRPMRRLKNRYGVSPLPGAEARAGAAGEREHPGPSRKKSRFSGKNRLKRVRFTCCSSTSTCAKSVLYGEVGGQVLRDAVLRVAADAPRRRRCDSGGVTVRSVRHARERVRLQLEVAAVPAGTSRPIERARRRDLEDAAEGGERARHLREVATTRSSSARRAGG